MSNDTKSISIKDVAKLAGVSISTVSNVLNGTKYVSKPLQKKVLNAVEELHYEVNMVARGLKSGKTNNIAVIVSSITSVFFPPLLQSIQSVANKHGYTVSVFSTGGEPEKEKEVIHMLKKQWVDGILLSSCVDTSSPKSTAYINELSSLQVSGNPIPLICLESEVSPSLDAVVVDDKAGISSAVYHLYETGRKNIAYIAFPTTYTMGRHRKEGYDSALKELKLSSNRKLYIEGACSPQSGYDCMSALLNTKETIDAVIAGNDQMAIGAMRAILDAGFRIPQDISVIGYDDNFPASLVQMSTVRVPKEDMGQSAFDLFLRRIQNPNASRMLIRLNSDLVVRSTTVPGKNSSWNLQNW